jgi:hypothetical protein
LFSHPGLLSSCFALLISASSVAPLAAQQAERRWIVDNSASQSGDGSPSSPFLTLAEAVKAAGEGDAIIVSAGEKPYAGGIALRGGQSLLGEGGSPVITADKNDVLVVAGASAAVTIANVQVGATGTANGIAVRDARAPVTLRDVRIATSGGTGLLVAKAQKLIVTGASSVSAVDAPAVNIEGTELDVVLSSVSAQGAKLASGILLQKTTGRFLVEGIEGTGGSGGTIEGASVRAISAVDATNVTIRRMKLAHSAAVNGVSPSQCGGDLATGSSEGCNAAVYLRNVSGVTLEGLAIETSGQAGVVAYEVADLSILDSTIRNAGDELFEHGLVLEELTGDCRIAGSTVERSASRLLMLYNSRGRLALVIEKTTFAETVAPNGQQGVLVSAAGDAVVDLRVRDSIFSRTFSHALEVTGSGKADIALRVTGSTFDRNASAINLATTGAAMLGYVIADNPSISGSTNAAINVYLGMPSTGAISGTIARNTIGKSGVAHSGAACDSCSGIVFTASGQGYVIANVTGNVIQQVGGSAIYATASQGSSQLELTATANLMREGGSAAPAIRVQSGALPDDSTRVCADLGGNGAQANTIEGPWEPNGAIHLIHRFGGSRLQLAGLAVEKSDTAAAAAVASRNGGVKVRAVLRPDSIEKGFEPAQRCTMPALAP